MDDIEYFCEQKRIVSPYTYVIEKYFNFSKGRLSFNEFSEALAPHSKNHANLP